MTRYIDGWDRRQILLLPECVDDYVDENNPVRVDLSPKNSSKLK